MNELFADTQFYAALMNPRDQWHKRALQIERSLISPRFVTTEAVVTELLTFFCAFGAEMRLKAAAVVELIMQDVSTEVVPLGHEDFISALSLYKARPDKGYSLPDCISMNVCRAKNISQVLTHDHHFEQEGFAVLL